ncbi:MAG: nucleoside hydrolase [Anaerolineae bacterium]|nr:nucleoside hydrolase [Anaerolineae bacterium]
MRLIIDTDAGVDDAQAIMMALTSPGVTVEAITTVTGNVHVDHVYRNVFTVLEIMQGDAPVYRGADHPLLPDSWHPEERVHGSDGLGEYHDRPPTRRQLEDEPAAVALVRLANENPGELTLIALGPLTNIALACKLDPAFPQKIRQFAFMGGTIEARGNTEALTAEFNVFCDPEAAAIVLSGFPDALMLSWETTLRHPFAWDDFDALTAIGTTAARFLRDITAHSHKFLRVVLADYGFLLPDPLAMAVTLDPALILGSERRYVTVELEGRHTRGQTVIDHFGTLRRDPNIMIVTGVDTAGVYALYQRMLG